MGNCTGGVSDCSTWSSNVGTYTSKSSNCVLGTTGGGSTPTVTPTPTPTPTPQPVTPTVISTPTATSSTTETFDATTYEATSLLDLFKTGCTFD